MNNLLAKIWKSPSARNVGKLLSANIIAQALGILIYPILTRIYRAEDFALLSLFTSIAGFVVLAANAEYHYAIVLPKEEKRARSLVHLCLLLLILTTIILCLSLPFAPRIADLFKAPDLARWWGLLPLCVAALGGWNILNYWYMRRTAFSRISGYQITQSLFSAVGKIGFGALRWLQGGMIIASVAAPILSLVISLSIAWKKHIRELLTIDYADIRHAAREYANFPKYNLPRSLVNSAAQSLPIWLLTPQFGLDRIGQFSLAMMAAFVPLNIIARACYQVLFQRVSELVQRGQSIRSVLTQFCLWTGGIVAIGMTIVYFVLPQLVSLLFGAEWIDTADIIRHLYPYLVLIPLCGSICFLSDVFAKQKTAMWMEVGYVLAMSGALLVGIHWNSFMCAVSLFAWTRFAYLSVQLCWYASLTRAYHRTLE
ncbi:MAG: lipopolysaccharide biosynthesis protein [Paludibacteraceae bacterium]|nr:lipopolysaccharide biosynthesis protein [Paludibacteraceae bacterium]